MTILLQIGHMNDNLSLLTIAVFFVALLYSTVGHAGASGYIAVMTLLGLTSLVIKPTALILNILVASLTSWQFWRAGYFSWSLFWPLALLSVPMSFLGGYINLPSGVFKILLGLVLLSSAGRLLLKPLSEKTPQSPPRAIALFTGGSIGLLSGLTGTGGGIFLTPLMIFGGWANIKNIAAISAMFILVNSTAGLLGNLSSTKSLPTIALPLSFAVLAGGSIGSYLGSRQFSPPLIKYLLAIVLTITIAGLKLILS
jgi:uncharacterized protein